MKEILIVALIATSSIASLASTKEQVEAKLAAFQKTESECLDTPGNQSTLGIINCIRTYNGALENVMNEEYKVIFAELKKLQREDYAKEQKKEILNRLVAAQKAWLQFRDKNAMLAGIEYFGGSLENVQIIGRFGEMTKERILELVGLFNNTM